MNRRSFVKSIGIMGASTTALTGTAAACTEDEFQFPTDGGQDTTEPEDQPFEDDDYVAAGTFLDGRSWVVTNFETVNREQTKVQPDTPRVIETTYETGMNPQYLSCQYTVETEVFLPTPKSKVQFARMDGTTLKPFIMLRGFSNDPFQLGGVRATVRMTFEIEFKLSRLIVAFDSMAYRPPFFHDDRGWNQ